MKRFVIISILIIGYACHLFAVDTKDSVFSDHKLALKVFLNCESCDLNYLRENFTLVNYVREPGMSDVQVFVTSQTTGSGGVSYNLIFFGQKRYKSLNDTLNFSIQPNLTQEEYRTEMLEKMKIGLAPYIMKTAYADRISMVVDNIERDTDSEKDPWKSWMFDIYASGTLSEQKNMSSYHIFSNLYIRKITPDMKFESNNFFAYDKTKLTLSSDGTTFNTQQKSFMSKNLYVESIGDHMGIGSMASFRIDPRNNIKYQFKIGPAFEYNLFSYKEASQKQLRFLYSLNCEITNYMDRTIYNKTQDNLYSHDLRVMFMYLMPWGYVNGSVHGSNYLNDVSLYSIGGSASANVRVAKGLFFNVGFGLNMYRNQIWLRGGEANWADVLLNQRAMETDYSYDINFGLTFSFGSLFNNTVNPRFGN